MPSTSVCWEHDDMSAILNERPNTSGTNYKYNSSGNDKDVSF